MEKREEHKKHCKTRKFLATCGLLRLEPLSSGEERNAFGKDMARRPGVQLLWLGLWSYFACGYVRPPLEAMFAQLEVAWAHLGATLAHLGSHVAPSWGYVRPS